MIFPLSFDIRSTPPTEQEIADERTSMRRHMLEKKRNYTLSLYWIPAGMIILTIYAWYAAHTIVRFFYPKIDAFWINQVYMVEALVLIIPPLFIPFLTRRYRAECLDMATYYKKKGSSLEPMSQEDLPEMLALCQKHVEIRRYHDAVADTGRPFTQAEFEAVKEWLNEEEPRETTPKCWHFNGNTLEYGFVKDEPQQ